MADSQAEHQSGEESTRQFLDLLSAVIAGGDAHLASQKANGEPDRCERWGWRARMVRTSDGDMEDWQPQGRRVGWLGEDGSLLLEPGAAYAAAQQLANRQGTSLPIGQRTRYKRLVEKGLVAKRHAARGRNQTRATIAGERKIIVHLVPGVLSPDEPNGPNGPEPGGGGGSGPKSAPVETARENGPDSPTNGLSGPKGPLGPVSGEEGPGSEDEGEDEPELNQDGGPGPAGELRRLGWARADALWHSSEDDPEEAPDEADEEEDPVARRLRDVVGIYDHRGPQRRPQARRGDHHRPPRGPRGPTAVSPAAATTSTTVLGLPPSLPARATAHTTPEEAKMATELHPCKRCGGERFEVQQARRGRRGLRPGDPRSTGGCQLARSLRNPSATVAKTTRLGSTTTAGEMPPVSGTSVAV